MTLGRCWIPLRLGDEAETDMAPRESGIQGQRLLEGHPGFREEAAFQEAHTDVLVGLGELRIQFDRTIQILERLLLSPKRPERLAPFQPIRRVRRLPADPDPEVRHNLLLGQLPVQPSER